MVEATVVESAMVEGAVCKTTTLNRGYATNSGSRCRACETVAEAAAAKASRGETATAKAAGTATTEATTTEATGVAAAEAATTTAVATTTSTSASTTAGQSQVWRQRGN